MTASLFICPLCRTTLHPAPTAWRCEQGHSFDVARQGYVNLLPVQHKNSREPGDSKVMVEARHQFLSSGIYAPIAEALWQGLSRWIPATAPVIVDAGCGEGYYLNALSAHLSRQDATLIGIDIAKPAIHQAAVTYKKIQWIVTSNRHLPLQPHSLDAILCLFGFACFDVFARALKPGGVVLMIDPDKNHLLELRQVIYPTIKEKETPTTQPWEAAGLIQRDESRLTYRPATLDQQQLHNLILMTPHFFRAPVEGKERLAQLPALDITVAVTLRVLQKV